MLLGNPNKIDLSTSSFERLRTGNYLFVDKTQFIEHFLNTPNGVQLIVRQRRLGKSLNMDMLRCFLTDKSDNRNLFSGTFIESSPVWEQINSAPVFTFDFKNLKRNKYKKQIRSQIIENIFNYVDVETLKGFSKFSLEDYMSDISGENPEGLLLLTKIVFEITGKRSYILIDEYDKLLTDNYNCEAYESIKEFETTFLSAGLKGNNYLEKALLTGVMRVSRESILSGLNNLVTYDVFSDKVYFDDFGFKDSEIDEMLEFMPFSKSSIKQWYNGVKINGKEIYNTYSVLSCIQNKELGNYWGRSGTIDIIVDLLDVSRQDYIMRLLNGEIIKTFLNGRISLHELITEPSDSIFYSLLVQAGYLSLEDIDERNYGTVKIPNEELMNVWKAFILSSFVKKGNIVVTLFDNIRNLDVFDLDMKYFLSDRLSYFDITENEGKTAERVYHIFVLGLLSAYKDISYKKPPLSNRESGDGRYDILFERKDFTIIFEFKSVENPNQLESAAADGLRQIDEKRYYVDAPKDKPLIKTAIAFCGKQCFVKSCLYESYFAIK